MGGGTESNYRPPHNFSSGRGLRFRRFLLARGTSLNLSCRPGYKPESPEPPPPTHLILTVCFGATKVFKNLFLDAMGEDRDSPRRNAHQGMWHKHVFNEGTDREIEVGRARCRKEGGAIDCSWFASPYVVFVATKSR